MHQNSAMPQEDISRVTRSRKAARTSYNHLSRWYDLFAGSEKSSTENGLQMLKIQPGEHVLEIGFGTGQSLIQLAQTVGGSGKLNGIDISEGMLRVANSRLRSLRNTDRVDLMLGDAINLPFQKAGFDAIFMAHTLELFDTPEIPLVLSECKRVLHQNGRIGIVSLTKTDHPSVRLYEWAHSKFPALFDCRPIFARQTLETTGFEILSSMIQSMGGLPIEIVIARKS